MKKAKADIEYRLGQDSIQINKLSASSGKTHVSGLFHLNYKNLDLEGKYKVLSLNYNEAKKIMNPLLSKISLKAKHLQGNYDIKGDVSGKVSLRDIKLSGSARGRNLYVFDENIDLLKFDYNLSDQVFDIKRAFIRKSKGTGRGNLQYDFKQDKFKLEASIKRISMQDLTFINNFPTTLKGKLSGDINAEFKDKRWSLDSSLLLSETIAVSKAMPDSRLKLKMDKRSFRVDLKGLGERIFLESQVNLKSQEASYIDFKLKFNDIKDGLILVSGVDLLNMDIEGSIDYSGKITFNYLKRRIIDARLNTKELRFKKGPVHINYMSEDPEIIISMGKIKRWKTNIRGQNFYLISKGQGDLLGDYEAESQMKIDASVVEVFNKFVSKANGSLRGKFIIGNKGDKPKYEAFIVSNNLSLSSSVLPTSITRANVMISFLKNKISIQQFDAQLVSGELKVQGSVDLARIIPDVNITFKLRDSGFVFMKKSNLVVSGEGSLVGENFPYILSGDLFIQKFTLINELTDFGINSTQFRSSDIEFLPDKDSIIKNQILKFNLNVLTREPVFIRNSLADLGFIGNLQILGGEQDLRLAGKVQLAPRNNKVTFKNNEFLFTKGNIIFSEDSSYKNPELDFFASANINDVGVEGRLIGPVDNFDFKLSSDKDLSQNDILSLIIFGYTEDLSNNLSDAEKESMTRAGVGSIIFDSFKINETLKNEFGLQVNLGTEISQEEGNYLSQRNSDGNSGRVRSSTTFEVKKKINDATSVSVQGTVSNNTTQRNSVNLNYKIDKNVSVEGVYESVITDDTETINDDSAIGADVKWKWFFK